MSTTDSAAPAPQGPSAHSTSPVAAPPSAQPQRRRGLRLIIGGLILVVVAAVGIPWVIRSLNEVSTDDAYVNGHVTFVAPRVAGQVARVLVEDNNRVRKGDLLVQLDKEPYQIQVNIAKATLLAAQADLVSAQAQVRAVEGQARSLRFNLEHAIEEVDTQVAILRSKVAALQSEKASLAKAQADFDRGMPLVKTGAISKEEFDLRQQALLVGKARLDEALQAVYQVRVELGLPPTPPTGDDLAQVPPDLGQTFSVVRQAQASLIQTVAQLGIIISFNKTPREMVTDFFRRDASGDIDRIYEKILKDAPAVKQAQAKLALAQRNLDLAELNLHYCDIVAEIDGVVTRRDVNPGNNVVTGQGLMAVRSLTEIWVDANFKETQLGDLRIGQMVNLDVDTYGRRHTFEGRISGFTMGTGSTLALLPAENATGNFVKVVQRLPVRVEISDYDPEKTPLFIGLSVTATVDLRAPSTGPSAGQMLQPNLPNARSDSAEPVAKPTPGNAPGIAPGIAPGTASETTESRETQP